MKPIGDLDGAGRSLARTLGVGAASIPCNDLDSRMRAEPASQGVRRAIVQEINHAMPFEIDQDGSVLLAALLRPIVDAEHSGCGTRRTWASVNEPKDGRPASRQTAPIREPCARRSTRFQAKILEGAALSLGAPSVSAHDVRKTLAEDAPRAATIDAAETPGLDAQTNRPTAPRKIGERSLVVAVNARGLPLTQRACPCLAGGQDLECEPLLLDDQLTDR
jgi:hypothetical protein